MFTRKHFNTIAKILLTERAPVPLPKRGFNGESYWQNLAIDRISSCMADFLAGENPEFSRDKFLQACGVSVTPHIILVEHGDPADRISFTVSTSGATGSHPHSSIASMKRYLRGLYSNATFEVLRGSA